jgi:hypothetical protein
MSTLFSPDSNNSNGPTVGDATNVSIRMAQQKTHVQTAVAVGGPNYEANNNALHTIGNAEKIVKEIVASMNTVQQGAKKSTVSDVSANTESNNTPRI